MDAINDPSVQDVVFMKSAQVGATEILNNVVGYHIDHDPCPMLLIQPTLKMAETWSKDRFAPMLRDTPALQGKVSDAKSRGSGNTILHKSFEAGHITMAGANSPASLASRPVRLLLCDEIDRYPPSAGTEGDPVNLGRKRTTTFWNRKHVMVSTPTIKGASRIEAAFDDSTQDHYWAPCPACGAYQRLVWAQVKWDEGDPSTARYECGHCAESWGDVERWAAIRDGEWRSTQPHRVRGFHLNEIYSPWVRLEDIVAAFLEAKRTPETLQTWINTTLGETWTEQGEQEIDAHDLLVTRCSEWEDLPRHALMLTMGVDVQVDRLETEVVAWSADGESWSVAYEVIHGDPRLKPGAEGSPWDALDELRATEWPHASGRAARVMCTMVDAGYLTDEVYGYTKPRQRQSVFAVVGRSGQGRPAVKGPTTANSAKAKVFTLGVDGLKSRIYSRLKIDAIGSGYCHFPLDRDAGYFDQLTAERAIRRYRKGHGVIEWTKDKQTRNEALDCRVYALAAHDHVMPPGKPTTRIKWARLAKYFGLTAEKPDPPAPQLASKSQDSGEPAEKLEGVLTLGASKPSPTRARLMRHRRQGQR